MIDINIFEIFPDLKSQIPDVKESDKNALEWWISLDPGTRSNWFDVYYIKNKTGLNLKEIVNLHKQQTGFVADSKKKRPRIIIKK